MKILPVDLPGQAIYDYFFLKTDHPLIIHSENFEDDTIKPSYFFRNYKNMPKPEQKALGMCRGKILDVGACAGSHALWLQKKGLDVTALEISEKCCRVMQQRGINNIVQSNIFEYENNQFDTILLLMNGTGIAGTLPRLFDLFVHLKKLLRPGGQILIDSSDLIYLYEDGVVCLMPDTEKYYGELQYQFEYKGMKGKSFPWLYTDIETLQQIVLKSHLKIKRLIKGTHYDYLAQIEE